MERLEVLTLAAGRLRARAASAPGGMPQTAAALVAHLCADRAMQVLRVPVDDAMLGGATARLQLWSPEHPTVGGLLWVRAGLPLEDEAFALAHELGHLELHRGEALPAHLVCAEQEVNALASLANLTTREHVVEEYSPRARRELEANAFAAELLAPRADVRHLFTQSATCDADAVQARFGISALLATRRLVEAVLSAETSTAAEATTLPAEQPVPQAASTLLAELDEHQRAAACAPGPALVLAGPGTGKTATLVGRVAYLLGERGLPPERILALTFSNRAAGEMRERLVRSGLPGERLPVMTLHAFATLLLRAYAARVPCPPGEPPLPADFRILDSTDSLLLAEELLTTLPLNHYRSLAQPRAYLKTLQDDFSLARDYLHTPAAYQALVEAMAAASAQAEGASRNGARSSDALQVAKARERAAAYAVWDVALHQRAVVDFGGLLYRAVQLLRAEPEVLAEVRARFPQVLVDEFQDTNLAAAELLFLLTEPQGEGLWVVGDANQSIYRWRGASPSNTARLAERYPGLRTYALVRNFRSVPALVHLGNAVATAMATSAPASATASSPTQEPTRAPTPLAPLHVQCDFPSLDSEVAGIAQGIQRARAAGYAFGQQAILCRAHRSADQIAKGLAAAGVPATRTGNFFDRPEIKDAQAYLRLAIGPDGVGLMRGAGLLFALGVALPPIPVYGEALARVKRAARPFPAALEDAAHLERVPAVALRPAFRLLGEVCGAQRFAPTVTPGLARFLLRPGGYAWQLARVADGQAQPDEATWPPELPPTIDSPAAARLALAALGELLRLAVRFDQRWAREPAFAERLQRAVRRTPLPTVPGAATPPAVPDVPVVACFYHYLEALREAEANVELPAVARDAVHVLTLHASKGLEFPIIYLPMLAEGEFPSLAGGREKDALPPGFAEGRSADSHAEEERCLFYVGFTRARDGVVLTAAQRYSRKQPPSSLLDLLAEAPGFADAPPLVSAVQPAPEEQAPDPTPPALPTDAVAEPPLHTLRDLEVYGECPRRYKYARIHDLPDARGSATHRYHRFLRHALRHLGAQASQQPAPTWEVQLEALRVLWAEHGPATHPQAEYYWQAALKTLQREWQRGASGARSLATERNEREQLRARLAGCTVEVELDRLVDVADGVTLVRLHTGRPREADRRDLALPLASLAHQQRAPEEPLRILLAYLGGGLDSDDAQAAATPPFEDVTEQAHTAAEKYLRPNRKQRSPLDALDEAAAGIAAQAFAPRPSQSRCAPCPYVAICPSDLPPPTDPAAD